jgi:hypothetical protein
MYGTPVIALPIHSSANVWKHCVRGSTYRVLAGSSCSPHAAAGALDRGLPRERSGQRRIREAAVQPPERDAIHLDDALRLGAPRIVDWHIRAAH